VNGSKEKKMSSTDVEGLVQKIRHNGIAVLEDHLDRAYCDKMRGLLDRQLAERIDAGSYCGNEDSQVLDNYFMGFNELVTLIFQEVTDQVMRRLIDDDYVLISPSARNRRIMPSLSFGRRTSGVGWHTDSRFVGGQGIKPSLCYMSLICLDDFTASNGATHIIPRSHLRYERPDDRDADLPYDVLEAPKGSLIIFDTALWHRVGEPSRESRWGVFNTYGPWFMKPYHQFNEMFDDETLASFPQMIRQLLHLDALTPSDHNERMATLRRVGF